MTDNLTFLSVCSGIEAASVAWNPLGWVAVAFSEIEKFPSAVLAHHYPETPNLGNFTKIDTAHLGRVDILSGGTPCQAFSVAGLRNSLDDARGNLSLSFVRLAHELAGIAEIGSTADGHVRGERQRGNGLRNVVWENVPGVLNTKDNAFGCFLGAMVGADAAIIPIEPKPADGKFGKWWRWSKKERVHQVKWPRYGMVVGPKGRAAWAVKDAQFFGLAQRRERVILVADFGNGADPFEVLFEPDGVPRDTPPSREARKDVAPTISARTKGGGGLGTDFDLDGGLDEAAAIAWSIMPQNSGRDFKARPVDVAQPLMAAGPVGGNQGGDYIQQPVYAPEIARCVATREGTSQDYETTTMVAVDYTNGSIQGDIVGTLEAAQARGNRGQGVIDAVCVTVPVTHTLKAGGFDASEDGTGRGQPIVNAYRVAGDGAVYDEGRDDVAPLTTGTDPSANVLAFDTTQITSKTNRSSPRAGDTGHPLSSQAHPPAIALSSKDFGADATVEMSQTLRASGHTGSHANAGAPPAVALSVALRGREGGGTAELGGEQAGTLRASAGGGDKPHILTSAVRRLTPVECERLMGFPDGYTAIPWRKKACQRVPRRTEV